MSDFTPLPALLGGLLIGLAAAMLLLTHGRIAGVSGLYGQLFTRNAEGRALAAWFCVGLTGSGVLLALVHPATFPDVPARPLGLTVAAGLLVGYGTRLGNGCTSGHGVCGISRFSLRSIAATCTFMITGALTVWIVRRWLGAAP